MTHQFCQSCCYHQVTAVCTEEVLVLTFDSLSIQTTDDMEIFVPSTAHNKYNLRLVELLKKMDKKLPSMALLPVF